MNREFLSNWRWMVFALLIVVSALVLREKGPRAVSPAARPVNPAGEKRLKTPRPAAAKGEEEPFVFDSAPAGLLYGHGSSESGQANMNSSSNELWFRNANGKDRLIARNVVRAKFSPDGKKIAYSTSDYELRVETIEGEFLAELPRACDPAWRSDSSAITFSAMADPDYPELKQGATYQLDSGRVTLTTY
jgi:hypothetical protein